MPSSKGFRLSKLAQQDLTGISEYTPRTRGRAQKDKYLGQILDSLKRLVSAPGMGAPRDGLDTGLRAHRSHSTGRHIIFYREISTELVVIRILHESMDLEDLFRH